jgi:hypothetical protein
MATVLRQQVEKYGLNQKNMFIVSDCARNMIAMANLLRVPHMPCLAHRLHNLVLADAVSKVPELDALLVKCRKIYKALNYKKSLFKELQQSLLPSTVHRGTEQGLESVEEVTEQREEEQWGQIVDEIIANQNDDFSNIQPADSDHTYSSPQLQEGTTSLRIDVPTRWNSTFQMISSILKNELSLDAMLKKIGKPELILSSMDRHSLKDLEKGLEPFYNLTLGLSDNQPGGLAKAFFLIKSLKDKLTTIVDDIYDFDVRKMFFLIMEKFSERMELTDYHLLAAILTPTLKNSSFVTEELQTKSTNAKDFVLKYLKKLELTEHHNPKVSNNSAETDWENQFETNVEPSEEDFVTASVNEYLNLTIKAGTKTSSFWSAHSGPLKEMAIILFSIPSTSVETERLFSRARCIITQKRANLSISNVSKIVFLREAFRNFPKFMDGIFETAEI